METLTVVEYADIRNCTVRNIRKLISSGKIKAIETLNNKNKKMFLIPFDQLEEQEKIKVYEKRGLSKLSKRLKMLLS